MTYQHQSGHDAVDAQEPIPSHSSVEHLAFIVHRPDHDPRTETPEYKRTHHALCIEQDLPCFVCGKRHSDFAKLEGAHHATTETHHFGVERSLTNAVNWDLFKAKMQQLADKFAEMAAIDVEKVKADPMSFVDSAANMLVLCSKHHREPDGGLHEVTFPEWLLQAFAVDGFVTFEKAPKEGHA